MPLAVVVRDAEPADAQAMARIYSEAVADGFSVYEEAGRSADEQAAWLTARHAAGYPVLVAEDEDGVVTGFAAYGPFRPQSGYAATVEHSIYVAARRQARGIGSSLLRALIERARTQGRRVMVAAIDADNSGSISLHERFGFGEVGRMTGVACKRGTWRTLVLMQRQLVQEEPDWRRW